MIAFPESQTCHGYLYNRYKEYIQNLKEKGIDTDLTYEEWLKIII